MGKALPPPVWEQEQVDDRHLARGKAWGEAGLLQRCSCRVVMGTTLSVGISMATPAPSE